MPPYHWGAHFRIRVRLARSSSLLPSLKAVVPCRAPTRSLSLLHRTVALVSTASRSVPNLHKPCHHLTALTLVERAHDFSPVNRPNPTRNHTAKTTKSRACVRRSPVIGGDGSQSPSSRLRSPRTSTRSGHGLPCTPSEDREGQRPSAFVPGGAKARRRTRHGGGACAQDRTSDGCTRVRTHHHGCLPRLRLSW